MAKKKQTKIETNVGILSDEQLSVFEREHSALNNAYHYDVLGSTDKHTEMELSQIYLEVTGFQLLNWNCNSCRLTNWKKLGALYYKSIEHHKSDEG